MSEHMRVEAATAEDWPAIAAIYNREIREGVALWNRAERSLAEMVDWAEARLAAGHPILAARGDGEALLGYASYGAFRPHDGYAATVEHTVYVAPGAQGRGVGRALLGALEARARQQGLHVMIGGLEAGNVASMRLHAAMGFIETARLPEVGRKFNRWLTLVLMQKILSAGAGSAAGSRGA